MSVVMVGGRYRLDAPIGHGGMASVWRALDTKLDRPVAVKRLHARLQDDPELEERFRREAQVVARLDHPNLVRLLDGGEEEDGSPYLVFELVEGEDLKEIVRTRGPLPPSQAARLCAQVARALAYAHQRGRGPPRHQVPQRAGHGDGDAKLTDFGIARLMAAEPGTGLTTTGMMVGTSDYLAPEQAQGGDVDPRTDVYSLGVVLYECLTGRLPFHGDTFVAVAMQHVQEPMPDPRLLAPDGAGAAGHRGAAGRAEGPGPPLPARGGPGAGARGRGGLGRRHRGHARHRGLRRRRRRHGPGAPPPPPLALARRRRCRAGRGRRRRGPLGRRDHRQRRRRGRPPAPTRALALGAVRDYDPPPGDGSENHDLVPNAYDANPDSAWYTERYQSADFGGIKKGVGLTIRLLRPARATELDLTSPTPGARFSVLGPGQGVRPAGVRHWHLHRRPPDRPSVGRGALGRVRAVDHPARPRRHAQPLLGGGRGGQPARRGEPLRSWTPGIPRWSTSPAA